MKILEQTKTHAVVYETKPPHYNLYDKRHAAEDSKFSSGPMYSRGWCWIASFPGRDQAIEVLREVNNELQA